MVRTKIVEAYNQAPSGARFNWGRFLIASFDEEWDRRAADVDAGSIPVMAAGGWNRADRLVLDLATGEGAIFAMHGLAEHDVLEKHQVWVCVLFPAFLAWLRAQAVGDVRALPDEVVLDVSPAFHGHRSPGLLGQIIAEARSVELDNRAEGRVVVNGITAEVFARLALAVSDTKLARAHAELRA